MKRIFLILVLISALLASFRLFGSGFFTMHDDLHVSRLYEMDSCFKDRQFPCRWVPDMGFGYGYPLFNFYPPLPYYLGEVFHLIGFSLISSVKIVFIVEIFLGAFFMYLLASHFWGRWGGLLGSVFYTWVPYHALDIFVRGALSEFMAVAFFPAIFWIIAEIINKGKKKHFPLLALFYGALLLSHNIMAMLFTPLIGLWIIFLLLVREKRDFKLLLKIILAGFWGLGLAAFFTLPAFWEKGLVHVETMFMGYFNYLAHYTSLKQLFLDRFWGFGASVWGPEDGMSFQLGHLHWILPLIILGLAIFLYFKSKTKKMKSKNKHFLLLVSFCFILALGIIFLTHPRSVFIWKALPFLEYLQFPWRFLAIATFFLSFLSGGLTFFVPRGKRPFWMGAIIGGVILLNFNFFQPEKRIEITDQEKLFSLEGWHRLQTDAIFDYLPKSAPFPPTSSAPDTVLLKEENSGNQLAVENFQKGTNWFKFRINLEKEGEIMLPVYFFPQWRGWLDKNEVELGYEKDLGRIIMRVSSGEHMGELRLTNTPIRSWANLVSLLSWWGLLGYFLAPILGKLVPKR
ncbi:MAG: 6-pyruvoyl-tetrahydropterin synthase-related protein [Candidatus Shapirobacteria bacterium]